MERHLSIAKRLSSKFAVNRQLLAFLPGRVSTQLECPKFLQSRDISLTKGTQMSPNIVLAGQALIPAQDIGSSPPSHKKEK